MNRQLKHRSPVSLSNQRRDDLEQIFRSSAWWGDTPLCERLLDAFSSVPREYFVGSEYSDQVNSDTAIPIGYGQTTSKPSTLFGILSAANPRSGETVLEIGSGSGYLLALLRELGLFVYGVERHGKLAQGARDRLGDLGYQGILIHSADGKRGWREVMPFDLIIVSAAMNFVPPELLAQLNSRGRLIAPIVATPSRQSLELWQVNYDEGSPKYSKFTLGSCNFVHAT